MELSSHRLTPVSPTADFGVWFGSVSGKPPRRSSALPPRRSQHQAAPKCLSGRTSYLRVRLAFHPYPQVIPAVCNRHGFGPPRACSARFPLPMGSSPGFGSSGRDSQSARCRADPRPFGLAVAAAPPLQWLNLATTTHSSAHSTKGTPSPSVTARLRPAGSTWFQALFHSPRRGAFHRSLTVLVHYRSPAVVSLGRWAARLPTGFRVSGGTHVCAAPAFPSRRLRDSHPLRWPVPAAFG
jgi:hypothetical protein